MNYRFIVIVIFITGCQTEDTIINTTINNIVNTQPDMASPSPSPSQLQFISPSPSPTTIPTSHCIITGLVARYDFSETSGGSSTDSSGNNNNLLLSGGATFVSGKYGNGISLNGSTTFLEANTSDTLNPSQLTVETWIYPTASPADHVFVSKYNNTNDGYQIWMKSDQSIRAAISSGNGDSSTGVVTLNTWNHVVVTYDGIKKKIYIDGILSGNFANGSGDIVSNSVPFRIGQRGNQFFFQGKIDSVKIYNRALTVEEVQQNYVQCL